jgi:hypothetical protein
MKIKILIKKIKFLFLVILFQILFLFHLKKLILHQHYERFDLNVAYKKVHHYHLKINQINIFYSIKTI